MLATPALAAAPATLSVADRLALVPLRLIVPVLTSACAVTVVDDVRSLTPI